MRLFLLFGIINGFLAVALGAFGAHGLEGKVSDKMIAIWEKAVTYEMFHATALLATGLLMMKYQLASMTAAGWAFLIGIILFSGSLYVYALTSVKFFAIITPFGGVSFLVGWVLLAIAVIKLT